MKIPQSFLLFACGLFAGIALTMCVAAAGKPGDPPPKADANKPTDSTGKDFGKIKPMYFASGVTGFFDPDTGRIFLYDGNLQNCYAIRELRDLGEPLVRIRN